MSVLLKRSEGTLRFLHECGYGCCTPVYKSTVKSIRRSRKRAEKQKVRAELRFASFERM